MSHSKHRPGQKPRRSSYSSDDDYEHGKPSVCPTQPAPCSESGNNYSGTVTGPSFNVDSTQFNQNITSFPQPAVCPVGEMDYPRDPMLQPPSGEIYVGLPSSVVGYPGHSGEYPVCNKPFQPAYPSEMGEYPICNKPFQPGYPANVNEYPICDKPFQPPSVGMYGDGGFQCGTGVPADPYSTQGISDVTYGIPVPNYSAGVVQPSLYMAGTTAPAGNYEAGNPRFY